MVWAWIPIAIRCEALELVELALLGSKGKHVDQRWARLALVNCLTNSTLGEYPVVARCGKGIGVAHDRDAHVLHDEHGEITLATAEGVLDVLQQLYVGPEQHGAGKSERNAHCAHCHDAPGPLHDARAPLGLAQQQRRQHFHLRLELGRGQAGKHQVVDVQDHLEGDAVEQQVLHVDRVDDVQRARVAEHAHHTKPQHCCQDHPRLSRP
mmetsp:Transcript_99556/g.277126  ORF Transcript_99556/g.277126 Transcript_99556/m.277126 type:complete len:209 (+) Transcript_99556:859-1485(+)